MSHPHKTALLGAFGPEISLLEDNLADMETISIRGIEFITGKIHDRDVVLARIGIGKVNAAMTATLLIDHFEPAEVIFTGTAGSLNPDIHPGDIIIGESTVYHDHGWATGEGFEAIATKNPITGEQNPAYFPADEKLLNLAQISGDEVELVVVHHNITPRKPKITRGTIATGDGFITSKQMQSDIRRLVQADAVEMEGAAVAQVCHQFSLPCLIIRGVSDSANESTKNDFKSFMRSAAHNSATLVLKIIKNLAADDL